MALPFDTYQETDLEREALEAIRPLYDARQAAHKAEREAKEHDEPGKEPLPLRAYLEEHGGELVDGEANLKAWLQQRNGPTNYDLKALRRGAPVLLQQLIGLDAFSLDAKVVEGLIA